MIYNGRELSEYSLWELGAILHSHNEALAKREKASQHLKFKDMKFPSINPEFLKLKNAVEAEIRNKQNGA